ncbi:MAG: ionic transporter y4hA [Microvirga sp.]
MAGPVIPAWTWAVPLVAILSLAAGFALPLGPVVFGVCSIALIACVFAAVHHAEVVAHRIGESLGTLVLAVAVTVIEVGLIVSVMLSDGGGSKATLARDTVFAAVMVVCNGIVGMCLLLGGVRHGRQGFQVQGANGALAVLGALTVLTLIVPNVTLTSPGPVFSTAQLVFAGVTSLILYGTFVFVQTIRHPGDFMADLPHHVGERPSPRETAIASALLVVSLVTIVGLAKLISPLIDRGVAAAGAPQAVVGIIIAALVLLPESVTALRAARENRLQTSLNLALGSALATIGLTIPAVAVVSLVFHQELVLGLDAKEAVLLMLTLVTGVVTLGTGRTTVLQGAVHLTIFIAFLFLAVVP